jgi:DHA1 family tetracycline resistance protein-like MFS transporter
MNKDLWWLTGSLGLRGLALGVYVVLWPLYVEQLGGGPVALGLLASVGALVSALVLIPGGWMADRLDRRRLAIWASVAAVPAPLAYALAPNWPWLLVGMALFHAAQLGRPAVQAMIADEAAPDRLATWYGVVMSAFDAGMVLGPLVGTRLVDHFHSYVPLFALSSALNLCATSCLIPVASHPPTRTSAPSLLRPHWRDHPVAARWVAFSAAFVLIQSLALPFVVPYWRSVGRLPLETIGWLGSFTILTATVAGPVSGWVAQRLGFIRSLGWGLALNACGWAILALWPASATAGLVSAACRASEEGISTLAAAAIGRAVPRRRAGTAYGILNWVNELARAVGPVPGGLFYRRQESLPFLVTGSLTALLAWIFLDTLPPRWSEVHAET